MVKYAVFMPFTVKPNDLIPGEMSTKKPSQRKFGPKDLVPAVIGTVAAATGAVSTIMDLTGSVHIGELRDEGRHIGDFAIRTLSGKLRQLTADSAIPRSAELVYIGDERCWSEEAVIDAEDNSVVFRTVSDYHTLEYRMSFAGITESSLQGSVVSGVPEISFQATGDFSLTIGFCEKRNTQGIERYYFREYNWFEESNSEILMHYGDVYFDIPSRERNPRLMTVALGFELAASTEAEGRFRRYDSIKGLLRDIDCDHVYLNDVYGSVPTVETTDVAVGSKTADDCNIIYLVMNGAHYSVEFAANVMIGKEGEHTGFSLSRDEGLKALREFIAKYRITGRTKILVAGYSRTAAGANLLGKYMCDCIAEDTVKENIGDIELVQDDLYVYCFETPLCGYYEEGGVPPDDPRYDNIWYVTNPDDPVTYVPTDRYGFVRYGKRIVLNPEHDPEINRRMLSYINSYYGKDAVPFYDLLRFIKVSDLGYMEDVNRGFVVKFFDALGTREFYYENVEKDFVNAVYVATTRKQILKDVVKELGGIRGCISTLHTYIKDKEEFVRVLRPPVERAAVKYGCGEYSENLVNSAFQIMELADRYCDGSIARFLTDKHLQAMLLNVGRIVKAHYPSVSLAYMMMDDPTYAVPYIGAAPDAEDDPPDTDLPSEEGSA